MKHFQATYEREVLTKLERGKMTQTVKKGREKGYQPLSRIEGISRSGTGSEHSRKRGKSRRRKASVKKIRKESQLVSG